MPVGGEGRIKSNRTGSRRVESSRERRRVSSSDGGWLVKTWVGSAGPVLSGKNPIRFRFARFRQTSESLSINRRVFFDPCFLIDEISLSNPSIDGFYRSNSIGICIRIRIGHRYRSIDRSIDDRPTDRPPLLSPRMKNTHKRSPRNQRTIQLFNR